MNLLPLTCPATSSCSCSECGKAFQQLTVLAIGPIGHSVEARICRACLKILRSLLRRRRRVLNPRLRLALELLERSAVYGATEEDLRKHIGRYATNTLKSLCARGFATLEEVGGETLLYRLTDRGAEALRVNEPEASR